MAFIYDYKKRGTRTGVEPGTDPSDPRYWNYEPPGPYRFPEMKVPVMLILAICCLVLSCGLMALIGLQFWLTGQISPVLLYAGSGAFGGFVVLILFHQFVDPPDAI